MTEATQFAVEAAPAPAAPRAARTPAEERSRWIGLVVLCTGMLMIVIDATIVNVALPAIQADLRFSSASLAWVVNAYLIAFGGLLLLAGRLGDLIARRGVFLAGLGVFTTASLLCGFAPNQELLITARFVQGIGGAMTSAVILGMIVTLFPEPREQAKAIGVYAFVASAGGSIGLLVGGVLTQTINWHWIFFINVPIGIVAAFLARRWLPAQTGSGFGRGADVLGGALITGALMLAVYTIVEPAAQHGWGDARTLGFGGGAIALLAAFLVREATAPNPLMPLRIFRSRAVSGANIVQALTVAGMFGMFYLGVLYLQNVLHYDALRTGVGFLPTTILMGTLSLRYADKLIMRFGAKATLIPGLVLIAAGLAWFARVPVDGHYLVDVLPLAILMGSGVGISFPCMATLSMSGATDEDAGLASGLANTTMQVGAALGLAVLATLSATQTTHLASLGNPVAVALTGGYHVGFWVAAGLVLVALVVAITMLPARRPAAVAPQS
ncbi:MAG TPA: MFS transporter [Pseudonocardiaceae bacterium]|nr:MFS transporter [Pseudonocardiaceae bacterium]